MNFIILLYLSHFLIYYIYFIIYNLHFCNASKCCIFPIFNIFYNSSQIRIIMHIFIKFVLEIVYNFFLNIFKNELIFRNLIEILNDIFSYNIIILKSPLVALTFQRIKIFLQNILRNIVDETPIILSNSDKISTVVTRFKLKVNSILKLSVKKWSIPFE